MGIFPPYKTYIKLAFCIGILYWLIDSGKINLSKLFLFFTEPKIFLFHLTAWGVGFLLCNSLRWRILLNHIGLKVRTLQIIPITAIGLFFNSFLPGSVSGDGVKAYYIIQKNKQASKGALLFTILFDRILAFFGLFLIASLSVVLSLEVPEILELKHVTFPILGIFSILLISALIILIVPLKKLLLFPFLGNKVSKKFFELLYHFRSKPLTVAKVLFFAIITQGLFFFYMSYLAYYFNDQGVSLQKMILIYPLGLISTLIPLTPAGLGVGHVAYDTLFNYFGLKDGANVFSFFILGSICFNLIGIIPYLLMNSKPHFPTDSD